jgi:glutamyl/glutaminyl-tRNA synthetase
VSAQRGRFAPSPTGPAHPGTLLAALLCWLDARSLGAELLLRLEDVDPSRSTPARADALRAAFDWLGLDWDGVELQSERRERHLDALRALAERGRIYACACSRAQIRAAGLPAADGGWRHPADGDSRHRAACRERILTPSELAHCRQSVRLRLDPGPIDPRDEGGLSLAQDPLAEMGDPVLMRSDGAIAYMLACVVDDGAAAITRVVRGRDLATSTATQVALQRVLGLPTPAYRHHFLLLEERGGKLAKLHGAVGWDQLRAAYASRELCGWLALAAGLRPDAEPITPRELLADFDWSRVAARDRALRWDGRRLALLPDQGKST